MYGIGKHGIVVTISLLLYVSIGVESCGRQTNQGQSQGNVNLNYADKDDVVNFGSKVSTYVDVNTDTVLRTVSDKFLSVAIDAFMIRFHYNNLNFSSPRLLTLAKALTPGYLRVSGTAADFLTFNESVSTDVNVWNGEYGNSQNFTMTVEDWDAINGFARKAGWDMIFGLNVLIRRDNHWDPRNALKLFNYSIQKGYQLNWELGNEPNLFPKKANFTIKPSELGRDFITLRNLLNGMKEFRNSLIFGPDTTRPSLQETGEDGQVGTTVLEFIDEFVASSGNTTNATTWHHYYLCSKPSTVESFIDVNNFLLLPKQIKAVTEVVNRHRPGSAVWLGETGTTCSTGTSLLSKTYVAGFMWMDKLGIAASLGLDVVVRQTFYGGEQGLLEEDFTPLPDYWLSVLYKRLVGQIVLSVKTAIEIHGKWMESGEADLVRVYAHCSRPNGLYPPGSVTVFMLSLVQNKTATIYLTGGISYTPVDEYVLTAHAGDSLNTSRVDLNGKELKLIDDHTLPALSPHRMETGNPLKLPPLSMAFYVLPNAQAKACMSGQSSKFNKVY
ncbi:heparanase-like isoform X1 [Glandiceps talaboti]